MKEAVLEEMGRSCLLMRTRLLSRMITAMLDDEFRPFGIGAAQFVLLVVVAELEPVTRAAIGRYHRQDRSTLTRNLQIVMAARWVEEVLDDFAARARPLALTAAGRSLLLQAAPAWREVQARSRSLLGEQGTAAIAAVGNAVLTASLRT